MCCWYWYDSKGACGELLDIVDAAVCIELGADTELDGAMGDSWLLADCCCCCPGHVWGGFECIGEMFEEVEVGDATSILTCNFCNSW